MESEFQYARSAQRRAQKRKALEQGATDQNELRKSKASLAPPMEAPLWEHRPPRPADRAPEAASIDPVAGAIKGARAAPKATARTTAVAPAATQATAAKAVTKTATKTVAKVAAKVLAKTQPKAPAKALAGAPTVALLSTCPTPAAAPRGEAPAAGSKPRNPGAAGSAVTVRRAAGTSSASPRPPAARARPTPTQALSPPKLQASDDRLLLESERLDLFGKGSAGGTSVCPDCHHELVKVVCLGTIVRVCVQCRGTWFAYPVVKDFADRDEWFSQLAPAVQLSLAKLQPA